MDRPQREVFGHSLHQPQRRIDGDESLEAGANATSGENIELELVNEFVLKDVIEVLE